MNTTGNSHEGGSRDPGGGQTPLCMVPREVGANISSSLGSSQGLPQPASAPVSSDWSVGSCMQRVQSGDWGSRLSALLPTPEVSTFLSLQSKLLTEGGRFGWQVQPPVLSYVSHLGDTLCRAHWGPSLAGCSGVNCLTH